MSGGHDRTLHCRALTVGRGTSYGYSTLCTWSISTLSHWGSGIWNWRPLHHVIMCSTMLQQAVRISNQRLHFPAGWDISLNITRTVLNHNKKTEKGILPREVWLIWDAVYRKAHWALDGVHRGWEICASGIMKTCQLLASSIGKSNLEAATKEVEKLKGDWRQRAYIREALCVQLLLWNNSQLFNLY